MKPITLITYLLCAICNVFSGKGTEIYFSHLNKQQGLSHYSILSIYQDERGLMWFGTPNGVNLYNGKSIKVYKNDKSNPNSLHNDYVQSITGDRKGTIFLGTQTGISAYDIQTETFKTIFKQHPACLEFHNNLYTAFLNRIYRYDGKEFHIFYELPEKKAIINTLRIEQDSILIGTNEHGLYLLHNQQTLSHLIPQGTITQIFRDSRKNYWITNARDGIGLYLLENGKIKNLKSLPDDKHGGKHLDRNF